METPASNDKWLQAFARCQSQLSPKEATKVLRVTTYQDMVVEVDSLRDGYKKSLVTRALRSIQPFVQNLKSFSQIIDSAIQAHPNIAALVWGGLSLVLELSLRFTDALEATVQGFIEVEKILPRWDIYATLLPQSARVSDAIVDVYEAVVLFSVDSIRMLRKSPLINVFRSFLVNYRQNIAMSLDRIKQRSSHLDQEALVANMTLDQARHQELTNMIRPRVSLPCHIIQFAKNLQFFSREQELRKCRNSLLQDPSAIAAKRYTLHGTAGVGKTSIALAYAYEETLTRKIILWISSDDSVKIDRVYVDAADRLGVHRPGADAASDREAVKSFLLTTDEPWLVVFDNVSQDVSLTDYMPEGKKGAILVTSRDPQAQYATGNEGLRIESFSPKDAAKFVRSMLPSASQVDQDEEVAVATLVQSLGGLPLALKQIVYYARGSGSSVAEINEMLKDSNDEWRLFTSSSRLAELGYDHNLATAWNFTSSKLHPEHMKLLAVLSMFDPDNISNDFINTLGKSCCASTLFPGMQSSAFNFREALLKLARFGPIDFHEGKRSYSVHRTVQNITLHSISPADRAHVFNFTVGFIRANHPQSQATSDTLFNSWPQCAYLAPHVRRLRTVHEFFHESPADPDQLYEIYFNSSWYLLETGSMERALDLAKSAEPLCDRSTPKGALQRSYLSNTYAVIELQHQNTSGALQLFKETYDIRKAQLGEYHANTLAIKTNVALAMLGNLQFQEVVTFLEPDKDTMPTLSDIPARITAGVFWYLAMAHYLLGSNTLAWDTLQQAIDMLRAEQSEDSQLTGYNLFLQAKVKEAQGSLSEALDLHQAGLDVRRRLLGDHIQTAASCYHVGDLLHRAGHSTADSDRAQATLEECQEMYSRLPLIGTFSSGGAARCAWRRGNILKDMGKIQEGDTRIAQAAKMREDLGFGAKLDLEDKDFDELLNLMDR